MFDVLIVCGFGKKGELGTGHLTRCLNIIKFLKKKIILKMFVLQLIATIKQMRLKK